MREILTLNLIGALCTGERDDAKHQTTRMIWQSDHEFQQNPSQQERVW